MFPQNFIELFSYGFVTYDSEDSVNTALDEAENLVLHAKKLNIGRAVRKQPVNNYMSDQTMNTWMLHPGGYASLTHQTGVTYYVAPNGPHMTPYVSQASFYEVKIYLFAFN